MPHLDAQDMKKSLQKRCTHGELMGCLCLGVSPWESEKGRVVDFDAWLVDISTSGMLLLLL